MFLDMGLDREKTIVDEVSDAFIRVRLSLQLSASPSSRSGAEINQDRPAGFVRVSQRGINIFTPSNQHARYYIPCG